ncbi:MAG: hypothetical protein ACM3NQ_00060 [Bacteroidales bacterium]
MKVLVVLVCLSVCPAVANAQGRHCTIEDIVGTYAFTFTGSSAIIEGVAPDTLHWNALYGPIAGVGVYTIKHDGTAEGKVWGVAGAVNGGLAPSPFRSTIILDGDCTGTLVTQPLAGSPWPVYSKQQFIVLRDGLEIRAVATETPIPTGNWHWIAHRIGPNRQRVSGDYLFECKNLLQFPIDPPNIFAGAIQIRIRIAQGGDYTGTIFGKVATDNTSFPVSGQITVNDDGTAQGTLTTVAMPTVSHAVGVFFNGGRNGYWLPLINTLPDGSSFAQPYGYCAITKVGNSSQGQAEDRQERR